MQLGRDSCRRWASPIFEGTNYQVAFQKRPADAVEKMKPVV